MYPIAAALYLLIAVTFDLAGLTQSALLRACVISNEHTAKRIEDACGLVKNHVDCVHASDRTGCLRLLSSDKADFAVFEPEDLYTSSNFRDANVLITHEFTKLKKPFKYAMVLLVAEGIGSKSGLLNKRFCHAGYDTVDNDWTPIFATYFQSLIMPLKCEPSLTLLENRFAGLSEWFEAACFPGAWTFSAEGTMDRKLKSQYSNLCALCDNGTCGYVNKYAGHLGAVKCLTEGAGDVAWVRLDDARDYFKDADIDTSKYKFMCPDGTTRDREHWNDPCTWITRPWPVVGARREIAEKVAELVGLDDLKEFWQYLLVELVIQMDGSKGVPIRTNTLMIPLMIPQDFLHQFSGLSSAYARSTCYPSRIIKWCLTSNLEYSKCEWLHHAARSYGLEPEINCFQYDDRNASIESVAKGFCDFYIAQPEDLMTAQEKNLTVAMELVGGHPNDLHNIVMLVKKESKYRKIEDLKGATACFTKYRSVGWNAFAAVMSNRTKDPTWRCPDGRAMFEFFGSIVFPGAEVKDEKIIDKTYECLMSGDGDVAFVTLKKKYRDYEGIRKICVEEVPDSKCILTWSTLGSVMVNKNLLQVRRREIIQLLNQMDAWFGVNHPQPTAALTLYSSFDHHSDVIFPELTMNLMENVSYLQLPRPYSGILEQLSREKSRPTTGGAGSMDLSIMILISPILVMLIQ